MDTNGVNYYKGVLLCSRPNESPSIQKEKPFCGRVFPHEAIGLVPTKNYDQHHVKKRVLPVLNNHKKWLEGFKKKLASDRQQQDKQRQKETMKLQKIKGEAQKLRENYFSTGKENKEQAPVEVEQTEKHHRPMKKGDKPAWAKTQKQVQVQQQKEVDQLLDFFEKGEVKDYLEDEQVNKMLKDLKERISTMKKDEGNWKKNKIQKIQNEKEEEEKKDDVLSRISKNSGAESVASQKTAERVEQLEKKKGQKQWDKHTTTQKRTQVSVDEQIAKNVADEVLRNYPNMKHHSNQSIRKLLEKQAHQQIKA